MKSINNCPICGSNNIQIFLNSRDYFLTNQEFTIYSCSNCSFKFTNPRPEDKELGAYYKSENYISHSDASKGLIPFLYRSVRNYTLWQKESFIRKFVSRGTLLDFGCGTGHFLSYCRAKGWLTTGFEPDQGAAAYSQKKGLKVYSVEAELLNKGEKHDAISLWHVLEHLPDLKGSINTLKQCLKENGVMVVAVPNPQSHDAMLYGKYWAAFDLPRHLYHFNSSNIKQLFSEMGFELIHTKPMFFDSFYVCLLSEKYKTGTSNVLKAFWNGLISNLKALRTGEYSSRIYVLKLKS